MLRDEAGLLTADRLATLLPALRAGLGDTPLDLHLRCQTALGPMVALEAVRSASTGSTPRSRRWPTARRCRRSARC
jgi:oxaloacetate decarboxylase alpha subunit